MTPRFPIRTLATLAATAWLSINAAIASRTWTELGPAPSLLGSNENVGRISAIACSPSDPDVYFVAGCDGGVWRSVDGGTSWDDVTSDMPTSAMGALAVDPTNPNIVYAGTGEANYANHSRYGLGLFKSVDGGDSWNQLAESTFAGRCFSSLVIDHQNPSTLYAAITRAGGFPELAGAKQHPGATGPLGVWRSDDGGESWGQLTNGLPNLSATSIVMDPTDSSILYAGIGRIFGHADNGIYRTINGGASWSRVPGAGLPTDWASIGRITVAVAPSDASRLYALITNAANESGGNATIRGGYRSDDGGATWTLLNVPSNLQATYGWFLSVVGVHPTNPDAVLMGGVSLVRSTNAGANWQTVTPPHVDMHALVWDAAGRLLCGNDGGVHRTTNLGTSWTSLNDGLGTMQLYAGISTHPLDELIVLGGFQDNGTNVRRTDTLYWEHQLGGDGGWTQIVQPVPNRWYAEFQGTGNLYRTVNSGGSWIGARSGIPGTDRNCFLPPYVVDPRDDQRMLYATQRIFETLNRGTNWAPISGDLTNGAGAIRALAISPSDGDIVYAATNDGNVLRSDDSGFNWTLLKSDNPGWPRVTRELFVDPGDPLTVYLAGAVFGAPHVQRSRDGGQTWEILDGDLPDEPVNVVIADVRGPIHVLYAGSDTTVYRSLDDGYSWRRLGLGLPTAAVIDLVHDAARNRLIAATQGRGVWVIPAGVPGDLDLDGTVGVGDLSILLSDFGLSGSDLPGDINEDGVVDILDLSILLAAFGLSF